MKEYITNLNESNRDDVIKLVNTVFPWVDNFYKYYEVGVLNEKPAPIIKVLEKDGRIVSHIAVQDRKVYSSNGNISVGTIGCVATHFDYRGKGYSSKLMKACLDDIKMKYDISLLITKIPEFFKNFGFEKMGETFYVYKTKSGELELKVKEYNGENLDDLMKIYHETNKKLNIPFIRPKWYFERFLKYMQHKDSKDRVFLFFDKDRLEGYVIVNPREEPRLMEVREVCANNEITYNEIFKFVGKKCEELGFEKAGGYLIKEHPFYDIIKDNITDKIKFEDKNSLFKQCLMVNNFNNIKFPEEVLCWKTDHF